MNRKTWRVMCSEWNEEKGCWIIRPASGKKHTTREAAKAEMVSFQEDPRYIGYNFTIEEPFNEEEFFASFFNTWGNTEEVSKRFPFIKHTGKVEA